MEIVSSLYSEGRHSHLVEDDSSRRYVVKQQPGGYYTCNCVDECGCDHVRYVEGLEETEETTEE